MMEKTRATSSTNGLIFQPRMKRTRFNGADSTNNTYEPVYIFFLQNAIEQFSGFTKTAGRETIH